MESLEPKTRIAIDVGLVVGDMEKSLDFYQKRLGLTVKLELQTSLIGTGHMVQLAHGESLLKLIEFEERPAELAPAPISQALGYRYMTLLVEKIEVRLEEVAKGGYTFVMPLTRLGNGAMIAMVTDPDGNIVELVQEMKG